MKKFTATSNGGAPVNADDLKLIFNDEIWAAMQALLSPFDADTQGIIVSGCVITDNSGNFDMTAGIVYLNGEFMHVSSVTNQAFTKYIAPSSPVSDARQFADTTTHEVASTKGASLVGSAPGSGQYIIISSLTSADDRRVGYPQVSDPGTPLIRKKLINIGDWNMDSTASVTISHGLSLDKIISVSTFIRTDSGEGGGNFRPLNSVTNSGTDINGGVRVVGSSSVILDRAATRDFDDPAFDSTGYNRGYIVIEHFV